jgi:hypothetical protein
MLEGGIGMDRLLYRDVTFKDAGVCSADCLLFVTSMVAELATSPGT